MASLYELQDELQRYLMGPIGDSPIVSSDQPRHKVGLAVYKIAYHSRLEEALGISYPVLKKYLGHKEFLALCQLYINAYPSSYRSIRWFGDQLAIYLKESPLYYDRPYLSELAHLEWTMALVFDAADSPVLNIEDIANLSPEQWLSMALHLHPSVQRLSFYWNVLQLWEAVIEGQSVREVIKHRNPIHCLLWRKDLVSQWLVISEAESRAMDAIASNAPFGNICEGLCRGLDENEALEQVASLFKKWLSLDLLAKYSIPLGNPVS